MTQPVRIGVLGAGRGSTMMRYCLTNPDAELVAICDKNQSLLDAKKKEFGKKGKNITYYTDFDKFLTESGIDAVVLANYANDHAPFAIKALKAGKHVLSEVLPVETLKEAVELCEAVEETGLIYDYAENYCYFPSTREMKRLYDNGTLGDFEYGEGEYVHNCQPIWPWITAGGDETHWRNTMSAFYYCTHSAGPLVHMVRGKGIRPIKVNGIEGAYNKRAKDMCAGGSDVAVEMVTLSNGAIFKSIHGLSLSGSNIWYNTYGSNGRAESGREFAAIVGGPPPHKVFLNYGNTEERSFRKVRHYFPKMDIRARKFGHSGGDWYTMHNFVEKIKGNEAETIDIYEALDMYFIGHFGYLSALEDGVAKEIPDFRNKEVREKYRNDTRCTNPKKAGDMLLPSNTHGGLCCDEKARKHIHDRFVAPKKKSVVQIVVDGFKNLFRK